MNQITTLLKNSRRVFLATHAHPDGDAVGSLLALGLAMGGMGKEIVLYNESPIPAVYRFLSGIDLIIRRLEDDLSGFDTAVILDCGSLQRIGEIARRVTAGIPVLLNIDHHTTNTRFGTHQLIDTGACATAEIVYRICREMGLSFTHPIASAIYTGILTDTGSFRFSNTNRAAFTICEKMVGLGVDPYSIAQHVYGTYSLGRIKLLNFALDSIEISQNGKMSMMVLCQNMLDETGTQPEDVDGIINYAKRIQDIRVAVLIQQDPDAKTDPEKQNRYHVSLRSDGTVDVSAIASNFGGGGHATAAGFSIDALLPDIKSRIFRLAETF